MAFFKLLALMTVTSSHVAFAATPACANEESMGYDDPENQQPAFFLHDAQACQNACVSTVYCDFFTFYPKNTWHPGSTLGGCYLQGEAAKLKPFKGAVSGPKSCEASDDVTSTAAAAEVETTAAPTAAAAEVETTVAPTAAAEVETTVAPTAAVAPATTVAAAEVTTAAPSPEPAPTSAEEAAEQAVQKLNAYAPVGVKASAAALGAASFAFAEGKPRQVVAEVAESAAKTLLVNASGVTRQIQVNHMAEATGKVFANQTMFNMTSQEAADRTRKSISNFANDIYDTPARAEAAVLAAGGSVNVATGAFPNPVKTDAETAPEETATTTVEAAVVSDRDITLPVEEKKPDEKSGGIPWWVWILIALALLACLAGGYMFLCTGSSKDKKKKTKTNKTAARDIEAAPVEVSPLLPDAKAAPAPAAATSVYSAPVAAAAAGGLAAGSVAQGSVISQGSPMYSTSARGFAVPQGSPVAGSNMVMMPQAAPAVTVAPPQYVSQAQPMMMQGGMSVASQPMAQAQPMMMVAQPMAQPMMGAQMTAPAGGSSAAMDLFNRLDANHDGQLSAAEFAQLAAMRQQ